MGSKALVFLLMTAMLLAGCSSEQYMEKGNSVYYWRTDLKLSQTESDFLQKYNIGKFYCRYFDVVMPTAQQRGGSVTPGNGEPMPVPNATITFGEKMPHGVAVVPTIYIMEDCMHSRHDGLAEKLVNRIVQMNKTHDIEGVNEIQIDCDYTARSRKVYYDFLEEVRSKAQEHGMKLSTTIRLHQLAMPAPPADYGVLMIYNTGDPRNFQQRNPILDIRDVQPYVRYLHDYPLPMAAAYPVYRWERTIQGVNIEHTVEAEVILSVKKLVEDKRNDLKNAIIIYHLDEENINRYTPKTYEAIFSH